MTPVVTQGDPKGLTQFLSLITGPSNIWTGARFYGVAIKQGGRFALFISDLVLTCPGASAPDLWGSGKGITDQAGPVLTGQIDLSIEELRSSFAGYLLGLPQPVQRAFPCRVEVPDPTGARWSYGLDRFSSPQRPAQLHASRSFASENYQFYKMFDFDRYEEVRRAIREHTPSFDGLPGIALALQLRHHATLETNTSVPCHILSAPVPAWVNRFEHDGQSYVASASLGDSIPTGSLKLSIMGGPKRSLRLNEALWQEALSAASGLRELVVTIPNVRSNEVVSAALYWEGAPSELQEIRCAEPQVQIVQAEGPAMISDEQWRTDLRERFELSFDDLAGHLSRLVPERLLDAATDRMREALEIQSRYPFLAIVAATSVLELVIKRALVQRGKRRINTALQRAQKSPIKKTPINLKLEEVVEIAEALAILEPADAKGLEALREARNLVHFNLRARATTPRLRPAEAAAAVYVLVSVIERLSDNKRGK